MQSRNQNTHEVRIFKGNRLQRSIAIELHIWQRPHATSQYNRCVIVSPQNVHNQWLQTLGEHEITDVQVVSPSLFCSMAFKNLQPTLFMIDELYPEQLRKVFEVTMRERLKYDLIEL